MPLASIAKDRIARNFVRKIDGCGYSLPDHLPQRDKTRIRLGNEALSCEELLRCWPRAAGSVGEAGTIKKIAKRASIGHVERGLRIPRLTGAADKTQDAREIASVARIDAE